MACISDPIRRHSVQGHVLALPSAVRSGCQWQQEGIDLSRLDDEESAI